ncbi:MAG: diguanylate cyclase [Oscillochloridaceae bacterium]|nr:diguanylate cyclase [Chloroflexaceae bacterium]MDW8389565.1 diguanylate cyclase [Oscillochloridaceae bacterium]
MMNSEHPPAPTTLLQAWNALLEQTSEAIVLLDAQGVIIGASVLARLLLNRGAEVLGVPFHVFVECARDNPLADSYCLEGRSVRVRRTPLSDADQRPLGQLLVLTPLPLATLPADEHFDARERQLRDVTLTISSALDINTILDRVVQLSIELLGADAGALSLYDAERDCIWTGHAIGISGLTDSGPLLRGTGAVWELLDSGKPLLINDYKNHPRAIPLLVERNVHAVVAVPICTVHKMLGALGVYYLQPGRQFTRRDQQLLETVARQTAVALENARLYQTALEEAERRSLLYRASLEFGQELELDALCQAIHRAAGRLMPCDTCVIGLLDAERQEIEYVYKVDAVGIWPRERLPLQRGLIGFIVRTGISLRITGCDPEIEKWFDAEPFGEGEQPTGSLLAVALNVGGQPIGALSVQAEASDAYRSADLDVLETLAATAAIAIQNARLFHQVQQLATLDSLTGVSNRRHFFELARREVERAERYHRPLSLLMIDVDYFKQFNDTYGHVAGDQALQIIAARMRDNLRQNDIIGRFGGEEFIVLLPETGNDSALQVAERLRGAIDARPIATDVAEVSMSVSIGVASCGCGVPPMSLEQLLKCADDALYVAKHRGRNQIQVAPLHA